jgi:hypothetical protein
VTRSLSFSSFSSSNFSHLPTFVLSFFHHRLLSSLFSSLPSTPPSITAFIPFPITAFLPSSPPFHFITALRAVKPHRLLSPPATVQTALYCPPSFARTSKRNIRARVLFKTTTTLHLDVGPGSSACPLLSRSSPRHVDLTCCYAQLGFCPSPLIRPGPRACCSVVELIPCVTRSLTRTRLC